MACPWHGQECGCGEFPFLKSGIVPTRCEGMMDDALLGVRKVSPAGMARHKAYLAEVEKERRRRDGKQ